MQNGIIVRVFIASPGDVRAEREEACKVIHDWNAAHSLSRSVLIEPVRVESHSQLVQGAHPQDIINGQLLERCDFLVAIFWSRLGSPTQKDLSGTLQEINEFSSEKGADKVLLFFCKRSYPADLDTSQLDAVRAFQKSIQPTGLYGEYKEVADFARDFRHQVDMLMNGILESTEFSILANANQNQEVTLSPESCTMLLLAVIQKRGTVSIIRSRAGNLVCSGERPLSDRSDNRSAATWEAAIDQLEKVGYIQDKGDKREVFRLTASGYESADELWRVFLLRIIGEKQGDDSAKYVDLKSEIPTSVFNVALGAPFVADLILGMVEGKILEGAHADSGIIAVRMTKNGRQTLQKHEWLEFATPVANRN